VNPLIGHHTQRTALSNLVIEERLPSSLLFTGAEGIGKHLAARELAKQLLCQADGGAPQGGCGACKPCHLFESGNHPDLQQIRFGADGSSVDDLREMLERLSLKPFMGTRKVAIFDNADAISVIGANIILKTLEEPRPENFFILIAATPSRLPQTLLSRCQRWFFDRLSREELEKILHHRGATDEELKLAALADGSIGALDSIKAQADIADEVVEIVEAAWRGDSARVTRAAQEWGSNKSGIAERLTLLRLTIRQKLLDHANNPAAAAVWAFALQNALDAQYIVLERHANPTLILLRILQSCAQRNAPLYQLTPNSHPSLAEELLG
jgi:DNA polymerase III delta' subunit